MADKAPQKFSLLVNNYPLTVEEKHFGQRYLYQYINENGETFRGFLSPEETETLLSALDKENITSVVSIENDKRIQLDWSQSINEQALDYIKHKIQRPNSDVINMACDFAFGGKQHVMEEPMELVLFQPKISKIERCLQHECRDLDHLKKVLEPSPEMMEHIMVYIEELFMEKIITLEEDYNFKQSAGISNIDEDLFADDFYETPEMKQMALEAEQNYAEYFTFEYIEEAATARYEVVQEFTDCCTANGLEETLQIMDVDKEYGDYRGFGE